MADQWTGLQLAMAHLMPGCTVDRKVKPAERWKEIAGTTDTEELCGSMIGDSTFVFWSSRIDDQIEVLSIERPLYHFSPAEKRLLHHVCNTLEKVLGSTAPAAGQIASSYSLEHVLVSNYLHGSSSEAGSSSLIINLLQDLAFEHYENIPSRSGFVVIEDFEDFQSGLWQTPYKLEAFDEPITAYDGFFNHPASHRHVDGNDAFYLADLDQEVYGVLRNCAPDDYTPVDRAGHEHLAPLLKLGENSVWVGFNGANEDVNIVLPDGSHLRWLRAHWHFVDRQHLNRLFTSHGMSPRVASELAATLFAVSDMRLGTLVLIPDDPEDRPTAIGRIDESELGASLYGSLIGQDLRSLREKNAAVGMLTSDGLTTIAPSGEVIDSGEIVDVSRSADRQMGGGGRTQAAMAASEYGLAVKVSEDGPFTIFKDKEEILRLTM